MTDELTRERIEKVKKNVCISLDSLADENGEVAKSHKDDLSTMLALANAELERQSVTDEDVAEAIRQFKSGKFGNNFWPGERNINLAIKALQDYRPEREVCEMCGIEELPKDAGPHDFYVLDGCLWHCDSVFGWEGSKIRLCPNCGRKLEESE